MKKLTTIILCASVSAASAATVASDSFTYPDGALVPNGGWQNHSGTAGTLLVLGGGVQISQDSGLEDANLGFGATYTTGTVSASFEISVAASGGITGTDFEYFTHFMESGSSFIGRTDVVAPTGAGDFTLGIASFSSTAEATLPTDFSFGTIVPVTISFNLDTGLASLTAGGNTVSSTTVALGETVNQLGLRQSNSSSDELISFDNLVLDYEPIPEPSSALLGSMALLGLLRRKR